MERITIFNRTTKTEGSISLRFRLTDGRAVQLYHKSNIVVDLKVLDKFTPTGEKKPRSLVDPKLVDAISNEISVMKEAYQRMKKEGLAMNGDTFEKVCDEILHPNKVSRKERATFLDDFEEYIERNQRDGIIGEGRVKHYRVTLRELNRFLTIKGFQDKTTAAIDSDFLMDYRTFLINEFKYVSKWSGLYAGMKDGNIPTKARSLNTVSQKMNQLQSFFNEMEDKEVISKSPFRSLGKTKKAKVLSEKYDDPIYLNFEEFEKLRTANVSENLREVRDAFVFQCTLGCRISDFQTLGRKDIALTNEGIAYVRYTPKKTAKLREEVETPLLDFAITIWKEYDFKFSCLKAPNGANGYNHKLKTLFKEVGLNREFAVFNEETNRNEYIPMYQLASNKLARKTYVSIMARAQINIFAGGLHKEGSTAVNHYVKIEVKDRFLLSLAAFNRKFFTTDNELNVIR